MPPVRFSPIVALLATALLAGALGACGGDDDRPSASSTQATTTGVAAADPTPIRRRLEDELRRLLEGSESAELVDVDCVIEKLRASLPNSVVEPAAEAADRGEEIPTEAVDAAYAAGQECSRR